MHIKPLFLKKLKQMILLLIGLWSLPLLVAMVSSDKQYRDAYLASLGSSTTTQEDPDRQAGTASCMRDRFDGQKSDDNEGMSDIVDISFGSGDDNHPRDMGLHKPLRPTDFNMKRYFCDIQKEARDVVNNDACYPKPVVPYTLLSETMNLVIQQNFAGCQNSDVWLGGQQSSRSSWLRAFIQKTTVSVGTEVIFFGDLHGYSDGLIDLIEALQSDGYLDEQLYILKSNVYIMFLGDIVDYGKCGADTLFIALQLLLRNPERVSICRGNHEEYSLFSSSFSKEVQARYSLSTRSLEAFNNTMKALCSTLPFAHYLGIQDHLEAGFAQCCHGSMVEGQEALFWIKAFLGAGYRCRFASLDNRNFFEQGMCGFNWNDVSGKTTLNQQERYPRMLGNSVCTNCKTHTLQELADLCLPLNIRIEIRGHQDRVEPAKLTIKDVHYPVSPFIFLNDKLERMKGNANTPDFYTPEEYRSVIERVLSRDLKPLVTTENLYRHGYTIEYLKDLFDMTFFVATFSNAGPLKFLNRNGCGILTVGESWEQSNLRAIIRFIPESAR